ncbi:hypothetical protein FOXYS1_817 [Fusarium oxysporum]|uniref:Uncharacterized protein n=1 Tax=Fusarium oxysporum TaxID=5507 RepID=A0A8H5EP91_FUSOX|nr:hypothetical protein FOXYS1_817 [Fusarium oxysporum]
MDEAVASFHGLQAAAEAAKKKKVSGQYATAEIGQAASELQKGQRTMWGPRVEVRAPEGPESRAANGCWCEGEGEGAMTLNVKQQDAANVVWAAEAAEVGRTGSRGAQSPECRRLAKPKCRGMKKPEMPHMK